jgi:hypothetical protein
MAFSGVHVTAVSKATVGKLDEATQVAKPNYANAYGGEFYSARREMTVRSARRILGIVAEYVPFTSVADFGCGSGTWLSVARADFGATFTFGLEGPWMTADKLDDQQIEFQPGDLERKAEVPRRVDLAISLEVAEHLTPQRAASFVDDLCNTAPCVLFGAAIPGQNGVGHINEQWQSYWADLFRERGYEAFDLIRPAVWDDDQLPFWYRQNCLLYVRSDRARELGLQPEPVRFDIVHPRRWEEEMRVTIVRRIRAKVGPKVRQLIPGL